MSQGQCRSGESRGSLFLTAAITKRAYIYDVIFFPSFQITRPRLAVVVGSTEPLRITRRNLIQDPFFKRKASRLFENAKREKHGTKDFSFLWQTLSDLNRPGLLSGWDHELG